MSWEIRVYWDCCPFLKGELGIPQLKILRCGHYKNKDSNTHHCKSKNCPIKVIN